MTDEGTLTYTVEWWQCQYETLSDNYWYITAGELRPLHWDLAKWFFNQSLRASWSLIYIQYRLDIYDLLNRTSSRIVRVAAASGLAQEFWKVLPTKVKIKNSTSSVYLRLYGSWVSEWHQTKFKREVTEPPIPTKAIKPKISIKSKIHINKRTQTTQS